MRLSGWRAKAPFKDSVAPKVLAALDAALGVLGSESDPECWVVWGDDPRIRYQVFVPTPSGLVQVNVRVGVPGEGPRASGKVLRWNRVQLGELAVEIQAGHRLVTFQVETQPLNGADAAADAISAFAEALFAAADGRPAMVTTKARKTRASKAGSAARSGTITRIGSSTRPPPSKTATTVKGATPAKTGTAAPLRSSPK
jgi:hypothetical protein